MAALPSAGRVAVAYSGGRDSTALLHATCVAARELGLNVLALHVHHGLSPHADAWLAHGEQQVQRWHAAGYPVSWVAVRLSGRPARGQSTEAWARDARYASLTAMAQAHGASLVLLAHHQRDQAETWLLQALRGGGWAGLSAMPRLVQRDGVTWLRPWLHTAEAHIAAYVRAHALSHIEDESNLDPRFDRNRLRQVVWPVLRSAFVQADAALAQSSLWAQEGAEALAELAATDLLACCDADGAALRMTAWWQLSPARRSNALRAWLMARCGQAAPASLTQRLMRELQPGATASWPCAAGELRLYRGRLRWLSATQGVAAVAVCRAPETSLSIRRAGRYRLPGWGGTLVAQRVVSGGVSLAWLGLLQLHARTGGEQFQAGSARPARSLKKQFQAAGVPPWDREGPLVSSGGQLLYVPGLGIDARAVAWPGQPQLSLLWVPDLAPVAAADAEQG